MATTEIEQFLRVEEEANHLLDVLKQLQEETQSYRTSRELLDAAAKAMEGLANNMADATRQIVSLREALQSISTSELPRAQEAVIDQVNGLRAELDNAQRSITEALDQSVAGASEQTAKRIEILREILEAAEQEQQAELLRTQDIITDGTSKPQAGISATTRSPKQSVRRSQGCSSGRSPSSTPYRKGSNRQNGSGKKRYGACNKGWISWQLPRALPPCNRSSSNLGKRLAKRLKQPDKISSAS